MRVGGVLRVVLVVVALLPCALACAALPGNIKLSQGEAYAACMAEANARAKPPTYSCVFNESSLANNAGCPSGAYIGRYDEMDSNGAGPYGYWFWCTSATCTAGSSPGGSGDFSFNDPGGYIGGGGVVDEGGCCATLDLTDLGYQSAWSAPDKSDATATGHLVLNGSRCHTSLEGSDSTGKIPNPPPLVPYEHCKAGVHSCYNPFDDNFCAQSDSGEWFCIPRKSPDPGGCISGATGSACVGRDGNPVPPPPDPPIQKGTPPDTTNNYTINDAGTTNNYTTNNYSGTSSGGSGSESPPPGSSGSPGGSGSNTGGSGNSGKNGTDASGKCSDGSVPTASGCSGTYRDDGCNAPPACHGDAVLCGIAANTHKSACAASGGSAGTPPGDMGDPTDNSGDPGSSAVSSTVDLGDGSGLDGTGFGYGATCPIHDVTVSVMGKTVTIPLQDKCDLLAFLKYIVLALAYFEAAKIIAGVK